LIGMIVLGVAVTRHYGESWDEQQFFKYADRALQAYKTWWQYGTVPLTGNTYDNYGPAYVMLVAIAARAIGLIVPWINSDLRHLIYFLTFVVGVWAFHRLCVRWLHRTAAVGATLLFASQPLIWGHAFISPKDLPFLTFMLLTLVAGFHLVDSQPRASPGDMDPGRRRRLLLLTAAWGLLVFGLLEATPAVNAYLQNLVQAAGRGESNVVAWLARGIGTTNADVYAQKLFVVYLRGRAAFAVISGGGLAFLWRKNTSAFRLMLAVAPAAILLGVTTSIRLVGPLAGVAVLGYGIWKSGRQAIPMLVAYVVIAAAAMYATWPYLWPDPLGHFVESARLMAQYPWRGEVLFDGIMYQSTELPRAYLPVLLGIQLTEPVWPLFAAGLVIVVIQAARGIRSSLGLVGLATAWFLLPTVAFVLSPSDLYDNFRQMLFILPPVFVVAGVVFDRIRSIALQGALIVAVLLPGLLDGARLHPYEYIYYNRFMGGEQGAFRRFEMDYWGTSYREAASYLNETAPANATVWVEGPTHLLQVYVRPDLKVYSTYEVERADHYDFVVALSRFNLDLRSYPEAPVVHSIERDGALLTVIKQP
jgi:hypothetical protein